MAANASTCNQVELLSAAFIPSFGISGATGIVSTIHKNC
jgi:hypothetical protein